MGNLYEIKYSHDIDFIVDQVKYISTNKQFICEMGEPLMVNKNQSWVFAYINNKLASMMAYRGNEIIYAFTLPEYRRKGLLSFIYENLPDRKWKVLASNLSKDFFLKNNFKTIKSYKKWHKLEKQ